MIATSPGASFPTFDVLCNCKEFVKLYLGIKHVRQLVHSPNSILRRHSLFIFYYTHSKPIWVNFSNCEEGGIFTAGMVKYGILESTFILLFITELLKSSSRVSFFIWVCPPPILVYVLCVRCYSKLQTCGI